MRKRKLVFVIAVLFAAKLSVSQNAYYDAFKFTNLNKNSGKFDGNDFSKITLLNDFLKNPFDSRLSKDLNDYLPTFRTEYEAWVRKPGIAANSVSGAAISPGVQSMIIDAVGKIVVEDFQNGVNTVFLTKIKDKMNALPELKAFFPTTYNFFYETNPFDYPKLGNDFKSKFETDLKSLVMNVREYLDTTKRKFWKDFRDNKYYKPYCLASDIGSQLINGAHPVEVLNYLEQKYEHNSNYAPYYTGIKLVNLLQSNFQKLPNAIPVPGQYENVWLQFKDLKNLKAAEIEFLVALIYQQDPVFFKSLTGEKPIDWFQNKLLPIINDLVTMDNICKKGNITGDDVGQFLVLFIDIMEKLDAINPLFGSAINYADYKIMATKLTEIYTSIAKKDYALIVSNVSYIISQFDVASNKAQTPAVLKVTSAFITYGTFFTEVVNAKSSDELKDAYRKASGNRGSFLDKRYSLSSLTLSAHPGIFGGVERLDGSDAWKGNVGITAPVGFEFTWGVRGAKTNNTANFVARNSIKSLKGDSWGLMLSFADIAAVFNYRFNDSESELPDKLTFKQVFSPGAAIHYGFRNSPIVLGAGVQYTPQLRSLTTNTVTTQANSFRGFVRLTWDLPLMKLYYKKQKK